MHTVVSELSPAEFDDRWIPVIERVRDMFLQRTEYQVPGNVDPKSFIAKWRGLMESGLAHTWAVPGAAIGAMFVPNIFTGDRTAVVVFWDSMGHTRGATNLLTAVEQRAKQLGCTQLQISALNNAQAKVLERFYRIRGFKQSETIFSRMI